MTFPHGKSAGVSARSESDSLRSRPGISGSWQALIYFGQQGEGVADDDALICPNRNSIFQAMPEEVGASAQSTGCKRHQYRTMAMAPTRMSRSARKRVKTPRTGL